MLTAKCLENAARFRNLAQGSLQHVDSGMCLSPKDGCMKSLKDTELVLIDQCGKKETEFSFTDEGSLEHMASKTCARPSSTPVTNEDTTLIVLNAQCDPSNNRFELVTGKGPVTRCNFSCNLQRNSTLKRCKFVTNVWHVKNVLANGDGTCIYQFYISQEQNCIASCKKNCTV